MIKDLLGYLVVFVALYFIGLYVHQEVLANKGIGLRFSLEKMYLFHAFFSGLICVNLRFASTVDNLTSQIGILYLATFVIKLILFGVFLYKPIFTIENLTFPERLSLLIPLFIFLLTEVILMVKILNEKDKKTIR
jgi:hypothetical protein